MIIGFGMGIGAGGGRGVAPAVTAPVNGAAPVIGVVGGGDPVVGVTLRLDSYGSWTGNPLPYALQWRVGGVAVSGATGPEFVTTGRAAAESVDCLVSVTNSAGTASAVSGAVVLIAAQVGVPPATGRLGLGLNSINDWSTAYPFVNMFKCARDWSNNPVLGANGYPSSLPNGPAGNYLLTEINASAASFAGRWRLSWVGTGTMEVQFVSGVTTGANWVEFDFTPNPNNIVGIRILTTDSADPVRDIAVVHTRDLAIHAAGEVWNPQYVNILRGSRQIRFMDMQRTNGSEQVNFADITPVSYYTYARPGGVPIEHMVALANKIGADPWFCIPHQATDAYVTAFATYVRANLAPALKAHFEYSNETWNYQYGFTQTDWITAQATTRWGSASGDRWMQWAGMRAAQIFDIIGAVYGSERASRVVRVAPQHTGWQGLETSYLDAPLWVAEGNTAPVTRFDAYAITGYFYGDMVQEDRIPAFNGWISDSLTAATTAADNAGLTGSARTAYIEAHKYDLVHTNIFNEARDGSVSGGGGSIANITGSVWGYHRGVATARGLALLMYEGGSHIVGYGTSHNDATITDVLVTFAASQHMANLYKILLPAWESTGNGPFQQFGDVSRHGRDGCWGGWRYLEDTAPRAALLATYRDGGSIV